MTSSFLSVMFLETLLKKGALTASQIAEYLDIPLSEVCRIAESINS